MNLKNWPYQVIVEGTQWDCLDKPGVPKLNERIQTEHGIAEVIAVCAMPLNKEQSQWGIQLTLRSFSPYSAWGVTHV